MAWEAADAKLNHYMIATKALQKELVEYDDHFNYLTHSFVSRMNTLVENTGHLFLKEHYQESPSYQPTYTKDIIDNLVWLTYSDEEKKRILDAEMDDYIDL